LLILSSIKVILVSLLFSNIMTQSLKWEKPSRLVVKVVV